MPLYISKEDECVDLSRFLVAVRRAGFQLPLAQAHQLVSLVVIHDPYRRFHKCLPCLLSRAYLLA
jgi:hypothetical protein